MKFALGTDLKSGPPPLIVTLTITVGKANLNQDQCLGANVPYPCPSRREDEGRGQIRLLHLIG